jgi:glycosyltransferase involved in cell wall biosynthesis
MKISVIIPALNEARGILSCLNSVKAQPGEFELIVADGGSVDGTIEVVRPHAKVIRGQQGRAVQMNSGAGRLPVTYCSSCTLIPVSLPMPFSHWNGLWPIPGLRAAHLC